MRLLKQYPLLRLVNSYVVDSPQPANLSYMWNFGSLLATCLGLQIVTGVILAMHYTPNVDLAFVSVEHIMRDVNYGWLLRYLHANGASFFFILVYAHIGRGLYYSSYKAPRVMPWSVGVIILVLMMAIAFLGFQTSLTWYNITNLSVYGASLSSSALQWAAVLPLTLSPQCETILKSYNLQPKAVFENLHLKGVKAEISESIKTLAGVYVIINLITGKMYVGSAITGRMPNRLHKHLYGLSGSKIVATAVAKYGLANFAFVVVDTTLTIVSQEDNKALLAMEDQYIQLLRPDYNIAPQAGNTFGVTHTDETKHKMRINYSSERREQIASVNRGKKLSSTTIELIRAAALARPPMSADTREKVSAKSTMAKLYLVSRVDKGLMPNGSISMIIRTIPKVADICSCSEKTIQRALQNTGIVKKTWQIIAIGKANTPKLCYIIVT
jgi:group I intron endonuclease